MPLPDELRQAIIKATSDYIALKEKGELIQEQQGGIIHSISFAFKDRLEAVQREVADLLIRVNRDYRKTAIRCRGFTFTLTYNQKMEITGICVVPEAEVVLIEE
jgi:hypothetical protein